MKILNTSCEGYRIYINSDNIEIWELDLGLWSQIDNGYKHNYQLGSFNLALFKKAIEDYMIWGDMKK